MATRGPDAPDFARPFEYTNVDGPRKRESDPPAAAVRIVTVDDDRAGQRLDNFVVGQCKGVPKSHVYQMIRSGQLRVNGGRKQADYRVAAGDSVRIPPVRMSARAPDARTTPEGSDPVVRERARLAERLPVLFEDPWLLVVDKPEAVAVHGGSGVSSGVIERLRAARTQDRFLELVHRIDRETSGVLVVARKRAALLALQAQWRERAPAKRYLAVVAGRWPLRSKTLASPLRRLAAPGGDRRVVVHPEGQDAITRVRGIVRFEIPDVGEFTLVEAVIETGRTHQIRVHLSHAGFPIAGDDKYGDYALNRALSARGFRRMYLHASLLEVRHPESGRVLRLEAPMPQAFTALLAAGGVSHPGAGAPPHGSQPAGPSLAESPDRSVPDKPAPDKPDFS
jgi:23S rRNA pseudouridine955/2504/2580 synthase